ncbi:hypothetical protein GO436_004470 [Salmonella enterica subsp. enterica serovar Enteritidis]|uniref:Uncharacterized protein n=2 Tax=Salmonella enterica I TaxID=59201 RepID=A0A738NLJ1_SALPT|nr:hypothetical protein [Salmonella enterica]EDN5081542.1 hypothetical protein [Salmonella enterica subsp. enterica serovar Enteritidis]EDQ6754650.1 hypothetical protein [Salmonella enterica subsp. enterica serovar O rough]EDQ7945784.1 hypothetical protein [Salmonella enterica subsp. diarizonae]EDQ9598937.1 hypothetical protein [Salmonella enterica subsp. enterica]EDR0458061.1 hypothetical protein [Salmonella enterica subsp. enterica serovar 4,[5],12:i:-]EDR1670669.1 hypothetical protein [Sal
MCLSFGRTSVFSLLFEDFSFSFFIASNTAGRVNQQIDAATSISITQYFQ